MKNAGIIMIGLAALCGMAWVGFQVRKHFVCAALNETYLSTLRTYKSKVSLEAALPANSDLAKNIAGERRSDLKHIKTSLLAIYDQCGYEAGVASANRSTEILF